VNRAENHLIELLPQRDQARLRAACEPVPLRPHEALTEPGQAAQHVYFPTDGFVSLVTLIEDPASLEVSMVGREGMVGAHLALGVATAPLQVLVQGAGTAWRMELASFRIEHARSPALQRVVGRYLYVVMVQLARSAACLRYHQIGPRLARCLLMSQDRAHADGFQVTQSWLADRLGVRRVGVTMAAGVLRHRGLIDYHRGALAVLDRPGLEAMACGCYAADQRVYATLLP
jgi:CRP-like cAMP-binding protein